jgi:hypothetical protein
MLWFSTLPIPLLANNQSRIWHCLFHYSADLFGIADSGVLMVGLILIGFSAILRTAFEGTGWIRRMLQEQSISP